MEKMKHMMRGGVVPFLLIALVAVSLTACNDFEENAYKTIKSAASAYDSAMQVAADYYKSMDDAAERAEFWAKVETVATPARAAIMTAKTACHGYSSALAAYNAVKASEDPGQSDLKKLQTDLAAAKAAATAALSAVDADAMSEAIQTIINLFKGD